MQIEKSESLAISYLRVLALLSILSCHILQALENKWAWILNIGVQVFFFISGYLYGHKAVTDWKHFFKGRLLKVYFPFVVVSSFFILAYIITDVKVSKTSILSYILNTQMFTGKVKGLGHLWFVSAIAVCYFTTPLLQALQSRSSVLIWVLLGFSVYEITIMKYDVSLFMPIFLYAFGYFYANIKGELKLLLVSVLAIISSVITYSITWQQLLNYDGTMNRLFHVYVGLTISIIIIGSLYKVLHIGKLYSIAKLLDNYSYEIYLMHHPFILGPLSLMQMTNNRALNVVVILAITGVSAYVLKKTMALIYQYSLSKLLL